MKIFTTKNLNDISFSKRSENILYQKIPNTRKCRVDFLLTQEELYEYSKCYSDIFYFIERYCIKIDVDGDSVFHRILLRDYQKDILNLAINEKFSILLNSRQTGVSLVVSLYFLHQALFNDDEKIKIISYKLVFCQEIIAKIKSLYLGLPFFLKQGIKSWNKNSIEFENGSSIKSLSKFADQYEGSIFIDHFSKFDGQEEIIKKTKLSLVNKIIISSVPNGNNFFHKLVIDSERMDGDPLKNNFKTKRIYWWMVDGRDEKWKEMMIEYLGDKKLFDREFDLSFEI